MMKQALQVRRPLPGRGVAVQAAGGRALHAERWRSHNFHDAADLSAGNQKKANHAEADHHRRSSLPPAAARGVRRALCLQEACDLRPCSAFDRESMLLQARNALRSCCCMSVSCCLPS